LSRDEHRLKIRPVTVNDAEALASMMARSESGWPWSISGGVPLTARTAREHIETQATLGHFVAEIAGRLVGVCEVYPGIREPRTAYVGFLNVEPAFQGRGIGRRLLRAAVDRAIEEGVDRIDIDTWGGNLKALPLYKKMGFFWVPETSVHMVNFIPIVLRHPMFREFFERHPDWYHAQVRDLSATEDLAEKDGVRIYTYGSQVGATRRSRCGSTPRRNWYPTAFPWVSNGRSETRPPLGWRSHSSSVRRRQSTSSNRLQR